MWRMSRHDVTDALQILEEDLEWVRRRDGG
jgi:hypothetical protein